MKKLTLLTVFAVLFISQINAQFELEKLFGGVNIGYAKPIGKFTDYAKGGLTYNAVVGYKLTENVYVGGEYASVLTVALGNEENLFLDTKILGTQTYNLKAWYNFLTGKFKPYASLALGLSKFSEPDITVGTETTFGAKRLGFGANAEVGFVVGGFNLSYAFNYGGKTPKEPVIYTDMKSVNILYHKFSLGYIYNF